MIKKLLLAFVVLVFSFQCFAEKLKIGDAVPLELGKDINGETVSSVDYKGKVLVITFWATWCGPCKKELPILGSLQKKVGNQNLQVVSISYWESKENFKYVAKALADHPIKFTFDKNNKIGKHFGVEAIPNLWIVDRDGKIVGHHLGYAEDKITETLTEIIQLTHQKSESDKEAPL